MEAEGVFHLREDSLGRLCAATTLGLSIRTPEGRWLHFNEADSLPGPCTVYGSAFLAGGSAWIHFQEPRGLRRVRLVSGFTGKGENSLAPRNRLRIMVAIGLGVMRPATPCRNKPPF